MGRRSGNRCDLVVREPIGRRSSDLARSRSRAVLPGRELWLAFPRQDTQPQPALVRHERLRQSGKGAAIPRAAHPTRNTFDSLAREHKEALVLQNPSNPQAIAVVALSRPLSVFRPATVPDSPYEL